MSETMGWPEATAVITIAIAIAFIWVGMEHGWPDFRRKK